MWARAAMVARIGMLKNGVRAQSIQALAMILEHERLGFTGFAAHLDVADADQNYKPRLVTNRAQHGRTCFTH